MAQNQHNFLFETDLARSDDMIFVADDLHASDPAVKTSFTVLLVSCAHGGLLVGVNQGAERKVHNTGPGLAVK
jgi:hypothetical protein